MQEGGCLRAGYRCLELLKAAVEVCSSSLLTDNHHKSLPKVIRNDDASLDQDFLPRTVSQIHHAAWPRLQSPHVDPPPDLLTALVDSHSH